MRTWRIVAAVTAAGTLSTVLGAAAPVEARARQAGGLPMTVTPEPSRSGETVTVSGGSCLTDAGPGHVVGGTIDAATLISDARGFEAEADAAGDWSVTLEPRSARTRTLIVSATCIFAAPDPDGHTLAVYENVRHVVTGDPVRQLTLQVTPAAGGEGTVLTASGTGCVLSTGDPMFTTAFLYDVGAAAAEPEPVPSVQIIGNEGHTLPNGAWTLVLGPLPAGLDPDRDYAVTGWCSANGPDRTPASLFDVYDPVPFDVTTAPSVPTAQPAAPVVATPTFTG